MPLQSSLAGFESSIKPASAESPGIGSQLGGNGQPLTLLNGQGFNKSAQQQFTPAIELARAIGISCVDQTEPRSYSLLKSGLKDRIMLPLGIPP